MAELRQLRNDLERLRPEDQRQVDGGSNLGQLASQDSRAPVVPAPPFAVAENEWRDERDSPSSPLAPSGRKGERSTKTRPIGPAESIKSLQMFRIHPFARTQSDSSNAGGVDPLGMSVEQLEIFHSERLLGASSDPAGPSDHNDQGTVGESNDVLMRTQASGFGDHRVDEQRSTTVGRASAYLRHSVASGTAPDPDMVPSGSSVSECGSIIGSQKSFQQAFMKGVLVLSAVLPSGHPRLDTMWYHTCSKLVALLGFVGGLSFTVLEPALFYEHMSLLVLSIGVTIGLFNIRQAQALIGPAADPMDLYAQRNKIACRVASASYRRMALISLAWPTTIGLYITKEVLWDHACQLDGAHCGDARVSGLATLSTLTSIVVSGYFTAVVLCLIRLLTAMEVIINHFVSKFFVNPKSKAVIRDWNHIHCLLRRTARTVDTAILAIVTSVSIAVILHVVRFVSLRPEILTGKLLDGFTDLEMVLLVAMVPALVLFSCAIYSLARAAHLTELCKRVPSLLNSMAVDQHHQERNSVVQFIAMSDAGFQIKGVKLTASFILKVFYVLGAVVFGMMTTLMSMLSS